MYTSTALKIEPAALKVMNVKTYLFLLFTMPTDTGLALYVCVCLVQLFKF